MSNLIYSWIYSQLDATRHSNALQSVDTFTKVSLLNPRPILPFAAAYSSFLQ